MKSNADDTDDLLGEHCQQRFDKMSPDIYEEIGTCAICCLNLRDPVVCKGCGKSVCGEHATSKKLKRCPYCKFTGNVFNAVWYCKNRDLGGTCARRYITLRYMPHFSRKRYLVQVESGGGTR